MVGNLPTNLWYDSNSLIAFNQRMAYSECATIGQGNRRTCRRMSMTRPVTHLLRAFAPPVVAGVGLALGFTESEKNTHWVLALVSIVAYGVPPLVSGWFSPNLARLILFPPIAIVSLAICRVSAQLDTIEA